MSALKRTVLILISGFCVLTPATTVQAVTPEQDFAARCTATGVIVCDNLNSTAALPHRTLSDSNSGLYPGDANAYATVDTTTYTSGGGSLLFTIPSMASDQPLGYYGRIFTPSIDSTVSSATTFAQNSDFYFQFRQRMDAAYITNQWPQQGGGLTYFKQFIVAYYADSCDQVDFVVVNDFNEGFPLGYSFCGENPFQKTVGSTLYNEFTQNLITGSGPSGYNCPYASAQPNANCFDYPANTWVTYYFHVHIGTWGSSNSLVEGWVATPSAPTYTEWLYMNNLTFNQNPQNPSGMNWIQLLPYWTDRDPTVSAGPVSHTWYSELIVSSQPIAAPGATTTPPPPPTTSPCDVNGDGQVNVADVQKEVLMALQLSPCTNPDNQCTIIQVEDVVNAVLGGQCVSP